MRLPFLAAAFSFLAFPLFAAPWTLDKSHAHVTFTVSHLGFSDTQGVFRAFDAAIDFDPDDIENASVTFTLDAGSVDTFWPARDKHVKSKDFLHVESYPEIKFVSKAVRLTGTDTATVTGDLTIRDVTREETFSAQMRKMAPSPFNPDQIVAGFLIEGEIDRTAYDMSYGAPAIGKTVRLRLDAEISPR